MDLGAYLLAHSRLAVGAQLVAWGHPVTSGLPGPFSKRLTNSISSYGGRQTPLSGDGSNGGEDSQVVHGFDLAVRDAPSSFSIDGFVMHEASVAGGCWAHNALNRTASDGSIGDNYSHGSARTSTSSASSNSGSTSSESCSCGLTEAKALVQRDFTEQLYWLPSRSDREYRLPHVHWRKDLPTDR